MKCPDCDTRLSEIQMQDGAWVHRCFKCGGFWIDSWSVNRLDSRVLSGWRRIGINQTWVKGGKGMCPQDGLLLQRYRGESVPPTMAISRCVRCGKWWFPGDSLYEYKPAIEAKINYFSRWGLTGDLNGLALPILSIAVMLMTLGVATNYSRMRQQPRIEAAQGVENVAVTRLGDGTAQVVFAASWEIKSIFFREDGEKDWTIVPTDKKGEMYTALIGGLKKGKKYLVNIGGREWNFVVDR